LVELSTCFAICFYDAAKWETVSSIRGPLQIIDNKNDSEKQAKVQDLEHEIDELVYELYGLTEDEIKIVDPKI
jgi:hypothetical protein